MQASLVALVAALVGIFMERFGSGIPYLEILGDALVMGAFIIAITSFLLFLKSQLFRRSDEIAWTAGNRFSSAVPVVPEHSPRDTFPIRRLDSVDRHREIGFFFEIEG